MANANNSNFSRIPPLSTVPEQNPNRPTFPFSGDHPGDIPLHPLRPTRKRSNHYDQPSIQNNDKTTSLPRQIPHLLSQQQQQQQQQQQPQPPVQLQVKSQTQLQPQQDLNFLQLQSVTTNYTSNLEQCPSEIIIVAEHSFIPSVNTASSNTPSVQSDPGFLISLPLETENLSQAPLSSSVGLVLDEVSKVTSKNGEDGHLPANLRHIFAKQSLLDGVTTLQSHQKNDIFKAYLNALDANWAQSLFGNLDFEEEAILSAAASNAIFVSDSKVNAPYGYIGNIVGSGGKSHMMICIPTGNNINQKQKHVLNGERLALRLLETGGLSIPRDQTSAARMLLRQFGTHGMISLSLDSINDLKFSLDGEELAISCGAKEDTGTDAPIPLSCLYVTKTKKLHEQAIEAHILIPTTATEARKPASVRDIAFINKCVVSAGNDKKVYFSTLENRVLRVYDHHNSAVNRLVEKRGKSYAVSGDEEGGLALHLFTKNTVSGESFKFYECLKKRVSDIAFGLGAVDDRVYIAFEPKGNENLSEIHAWDLNSLQPCSTHLQTKTSTASRTRNSQKLRCQGMICALGVSPNGNMLALGSVFREHPEDSTRELAIHSTNDLSRIALVSTGQYDTNGVGFSPCGRYVYAYGTTNACSVFDVRNFSQKYLYLYHDYPHDRVGLNPNTALEATGITDATWLVNTNLLATCGEDGMVRFWDVARIEPWVNSNPEYHTIKTDIDMPISRMAFNFDETMLAVAGGNRVYVYKHIF